MIQLTERGRRNQRHLVLPEGLSSYFEPREKYPEGSFANTVQNVGAGGVLKTYGLKKQAVDHCWAQVYLYRNGVAAPVLETVRKHGAQGWGYISARCQVITTNSEFRKYEYGSPPVGGPTPPAKHLAYYLCRIQYLLREMGILWNDGKLDNVGVWENKLLMLDSGCIHLHEWLSPKARKGIMEGGLSRRHPRHYKTQKGLWG